MVTSLSAWLSLAPDIYTLIGVSDANGYKLLLTRGQAKSFSVKRDTNTKGYVIIEDWL